MTDVANTSEHTDGSPPSVERDYQPLVRFYVQSRGNYDEGDVENNENISLPETGRREYIVSLKVKPSQRCWSLPVHP